METECNFLYSIGYGNRRIDDFICLIKNHQIKFLADLRSKPYSRFNTDFSQKNLKAILQANGIKYIFMGDSLGGLPSDSSCYIDGYVDYKVVDGKDFYKKGIDRLLTAHKKKIPLVLMCSEKKPHECHRSKLIGETLRKYSIDVNHIDEIGVVASQEQVISKIHNKQYSLFDDDRSYTSRKRYIST